MTLPSTLAGWLSATGLYSTVENDTNLVFSGDQQKLRQLIPTSNADIVLMVNAAAIYDLTQPPFGPPPGGGGFSLPNHYIVMTGPFYSGDDPAWIGIDSWSWGKPYSGWQGSDRFFGNYFGFIGSTTP
jgi:hypothetical protein